VSFILLFIASFLGLLLVMVPIIARWWVGDGMPLSPDWYIALALLLLTQCVVGVWGTASLFRSYGMLAATKPSAESVAEAPNNRVWTPPSSGDL
jgi:hypothetical protein